MMKPEPDVYADQATPSSWLATRGMAYCLVMLVLMLLTAFVACYVLGGVTLPFQGLLSWPLGAH